jgi:hypothetical protein
MQLILPKSKGKWQGIFSNKYAGDFSYGMNIDFGRIPGKLVLSGKMNVLVDSDTDFSMSVPQKFLRTNADGTDRWWMLHASGMAKTTGTTPHLGWVTDTLASSPTDTPYDMVTHEMANGEQRLLVSTDTDIAILNTDTSANVWTTAGLSGKFAGGTLATGVEHILVKLERLVAVADSDTNGVAVVHTIDRSDIVARNRLSFPVGYSMKCAYTSSKRFWFGLINNYGGLGKIAEWDGFSESYNQLYEVPFNCPLSGWVKDEVPYFVGENGVIVKFNGNGFSEFQKFPMYDERLFFSTDPNSNTTGIARYGCAIDGDQVLMNVAAPSSRRMRGGLWVLDLGTKDLHHFASLSRYKQTDTDVDFGQSRLFRAGGLVNVFGEASQFLAGAGVYKTYDSVTKNAIFRFYENFGSGSTVLGTNRGFFVTTVTTARQAKDLFQGVWIKFRKFVTGQNSITVRHRTDEPLRNAGALDGSVLNASITWVDTTHFTCAGPTGIKVGHLVEITAGLNAGCIFTISALSGAFDGSTTRTVTLAETAPVAGTTVANARFDNWVKDGEITDTSLSADYTAFKGTDTDGGNSTSETQIEVMIELRGIENEISEISIGSRDGLNRDN